ncbi:SUKH-4 family immunity protein [Streptomyces sp. NPDC007088]|uniref:SUKH-4 family immunity protein n=1 Tax=Streptomyces sp. NPDC007088 TaxID=3364773 RepID=UPI0036952F7D
MVTFAQAQERAEQWINGDLPPYQHRQVLVREFGLGFVVWAQDREGGPVSDGGGQRLVIARDGGEASLWPALPVGEVIRRYEEEYGVLEGAAEPASPPERIDLNQTSFLLSPPEWLQEAADKLGIPDRRGADRDRPAAAQGPATGQGAATGGPVAASGGAGPDSAPSAPAPAPAPSPSSAPASSSAAPAGGTPWAGTDTAHDGDSRSVPPPATVFAPPLPEGAGAGPGPVAEARTELLSGGAPYAPPPGAPAAPGTPGAPGASPGSSVPGAGDISEAATSKAQPPQRRGGGSSVPPPPGAPGVPGGAGPGRPGPSAPSGPPAPGTPAQGVHHAETVLSEPGQSLGGRGGPSAPGAPGGFQAAPPPAPPQAPGAPGTPPQGVHHAATVLSTPGSATPAPPGAPLPPPSGPPVSGPGAPPPPSGAPYPPPQGRPPGPGTPPPGYGYPQQQGLPTVGPGYQAVLRYRAPDGSEQQLIRRSAPGTPHPEWQILHELRAMNVPPRQVLELHTELESCELPGAYCARMIRETFPQARITSIAPYGTDHASRQQGMAQLLAHQGELHQVADGPARPAPVRAPLPQVPPLPPVPPEGIAHELAQAFGPQGLFRFEERAVSRQGVPELVARTLVTAGLPYDMGPFFWAQAQPGRPVPTLAELAQERGVPAAVDAGTYLVMGSDFGKALCVQYGTAHIVAVPVEGGPNGAPVPPQFVNSGLPEFARCLALLGRMWRLRFGLTPEQAGRWTVDFQAQLAALDAAALGSPETWWSVLLEQMWDGLL